MHPQAYHAHHHRRIFTGHIAPKFAQTPGSYLDRSTWMSYFHLHSVYILSTSTESAPFFERYPADQIDNEQSTKRQTLIKNICRPQAYNHVCQIPDCPARYQQRRYGLQEQVSYARFPHYLFRSQPPSHHRQSKVLSFSAVKDPPIRPRSPSATLALATSTRARPTATTKNFPTKAATSSTQRMTMRMCRTLCPARKSRM